MRLWKLLFPYLTPNPWPRRMYLSLLQVGLGKRDKAKDMVVASLSHPAPDGWLRNITSR